jgi:hypothetical protein
MRGGSAAPRTLPVTRAIASPASNTSVLARPEGCFPASEERELGSPVATARGLLDSVPGSVWGRVVKRD